ncbi:glycosyltransferase family 4 protein [Exiguobacterium aurantiacum]|uniref:glycosyltransferase family 4 protein n=1 Tax=Exiguobacterium aurantiacum TaxID=33987 RepID=UPI001E3F36C1|nr:glycosyltransferase family 4 protein [Exiguobacterium aurantiacum]
MKIAIVGPVNTASYYGGVAVFVENLAEGLLNQNVDVEIITDYSETEYTRNGVKITSISDKPLRRSFELSKKLFKALEENPPDFVITSLEYGLLNVKLSKSHLNTKSIHILHGFMSNNNLKKNNGLIKGNIIKYITQYICKYSNYVLSNSSLTASLNHETSNILSDGILNLAPSYDYINSIESKTGKITKKRGKVIYIGRLAKSKNIDSLIKALSYVNNKIDLHIIGDGSERSKLEELAENNSHVYFHGRKDMESISTELLESQVFVSLNPQESFGITFNEAILARCKIVAPYTGGQNDTLLKIKNGVRFVNPYSSVQIAQGLDKAINDVLDPEEEIYKSIYYSFDQVALSLIEFIKINIK